MSVSCSPLDELGSVARLSKTPNILVQSFRLEPPPAGEEEAQEADEGLHPPGQHAAPLHPGEGGDPQEDGRRSWTAATPHHQHHQHQHQSAQRRRRSAPRHAAQGPR